jgi:hypothetical protein
MKQTTITFSGPANHGKVPALRAAAAFLLERGMGVTVPEGTPTAALLSKHLDLAGVKVFVVACLPEGYYKASGQKQQPVYGYDVFVELTGPAGSGKTRIGTALATFLKSRGAAVAYFDEGSDGASVTYFDEAPVPGSHGLTPDLRDLSTTLTLKEQQ